MLRVRELWPLPPPEATTCASAVADASGPGREMVEGEEAVAAADTIE